jgi:hypothetical protein
VAKRARYPRRSEVNPAIERWLLTGATEGLPFECHPPSVSLGAMWARHGDALLETFIENTPGCRPFGWWQCDAVEPRRRLSGTGTPIWEALRGYAKEYWFGLPSRFVTRWDCAYYSGQARNVRGELIGQEFAGRSFAGQAIDPDDPPTYESEATYLERLGLLRAGERARLTPQDFEPEVIPAEGDEDR